MLIFQRMPIYYLTGGASDYCEQCWKICGRAPRKRRKPATRLQKPVKPAHLKYVRYHPTAVVTPGWSGYPEPRDPVRIPAYRTYATAVSLRNLRAMDAVPASAEVGGVVQLRVGRKRKAAD